MSQVNAWWPVALSHQLRNAPLACQLLGLPLVLFRDEGGRAAVLPDRCPHRFAPLSAGKVRDGQIECPYHGWRFAADGRCTRVPGTEQAACNKPLLDSVQSCEAHGLVWVSPGPERPQAPPVAPAPQQQNLDTFWITDHKAVLTPGRCGKFPRRVSHAFRACRVDTTRQAAAKTQGSGARPRRRRGGGL